MKYDRRSEDVLHRTPRQPLLRDAAGLVTILDVHPTTLAWLRAFGSHRVMSLGVERFGQSAEIPDLFRAYGLDDDAVMDAAARLCIREHERN